MSGLEGGEGVPSPVVKRVVGVVNTAQTGIQGYIERWKPIIWADLFRTYLNGNNRQGTDIEEQLSAVLREPHSDYSPTKILEDFAHTARVALDKPHHNPHHRQKAADRVQEASLKVLGIFDRVIKNMPETPARCAIGAVKGMQLMMELGLLENPAVQEKAVQMLRDYIVFEDFQHDHRQRTIIDPAQKLLAQLSPPPLPGP